MQNADFNFHGAIIFYMTICSQLKSKKSVGSYADMTANRLTLNNLFYLILKPDDGISSILILILLHYFVSSAAASSQDVHISVSSS